jgi:hypothetical protein
MQLALAVTDFFIQGVSFANDLTCQTPPSIFSRANAIVLLMLHAPQLVDRRAPVAAMATWRPRQVCDRVVRTFHRVLQPDHTNTC